MPRILSVLPGEYEPAPCNHSGAWIGQCYFCGLRGVIEVGKKAPEGFVWSLQVMENRYLLFCPKCWEGGGNEKSLEVD